MTPTNPPSVAPAEVVPVRRGPRISWTWLFPILAIAVTGWLFWQKEQAKGPVIEIAFAEAPGIEPGKTHLVYRGVKAGEVTGVRLDHKLNQVVVEVQLMAYASGVARQGTQFWIDKPLVSLHGITGLEALIQGNSIQALVTDPDGTSQYSFTALEEPPLSRQNAPTLSIVLEAEAIPFINRGTPVFHRGTQVGWISEKELSPDGRAVAGVVIREQYAGVVRKNSRFWLLSAASIGASPGQIQLNLPSISAILDGGVAFDHFEEPGAAISEGAVFELSANEVAARADGPEVTIEFTSAIAMRPGETRVSYLGQPVGIVTKVNPLPGEGKVRATIRLARSVSHLVNSSARFLFIRPAITWKGVTGLESLVTGPYINFVPGTGGEPANHFVALPADEVQELELQSEFSGLEIVLQAAEIPQMEPGVPVYYEGMQVGAVLAKEPAMNGGLALRVGFRPEYAHLVRKNSRFWRVPATQVGIGPGNLQVSLQGLASLVWGGIAFRSFEETADPVEPAGALAEFPLFSTREQAAAISPPVRISFSEGTGLHAGLTQVRYLGQPAGLVESLEVSKSGVAATVRFFPGFDFLRRTGSQFSIVRPEISLQTGVSGLETLVSGVFIACVAGDGPGFASEFFGVQTQEEKLVATPGFEIQLRVPVTKIAPGAPVTYNDMMVGEITTKALSENGNEILLTAVIFPEYRRLVRTSSIFWDATGVRAKVGFLKVEIDAPTLVEPQGSVAFFTPPDSGEPVGEGATFTLADKPPRFPQRK